MSVLTVGLLSAAVLAIAMPHLAALAMRVRGRERPAGGRRLALVDALASGLASMMRHQLRADPAALERSIDELRSTLRLEQRI